MTKKETGYALKAFRKANDLKQKDIGDILGLTNRMISHIEQGNRALKDNEIKQLQERFPDFLKDYFRKSRIPSIPFNPIENFISLQQDHLIKHRGQYTIWMLNMVDIPMLESNKLETTWAINIVEGINYSVIWDLTQYDSRNKRLFNDFRRAIVRIQNNVNKIIEDAEESGLNGQDLPIAPRNDDPMKSAGIDVYAFYSRYQLDYILKRLRDEEEVNKLLSEKGLPPQNYVKNSEHANLNNLLEEYLVAADTFSNIDDRSGQRIRFHTPFAEESFIESAQHWRFLREVSMYKSAIVVYVPPGRNQKHLNSAQPMAVLEVTESCNSFSDKEQKKAGHLFMGDAIGDHYIEAVSEFARWHKNRYGLCTNSFLEGIGYTNEKNEKKLWIQKLLAIEDKKINS